MPFLQGYCSGSSAPDMQTCGVPGCAYSPESLAEQRDLYGIQIQSNELYPRERLGPRRPRSLPHVVNTQVLDEGLEKQSSEGLEKVLEAFPRELSGLD